MEKKLINEILEKIIFLIEKEKEGIDEALEEKRADDHRSRARVIDTLLFLDELKKMAEKQEIFLTNKRFNQILHFCKWTDYSVPDDRREEE